MVKKSTPLISQFILGIETSCDDTSLAIFDVKKNKITHQITKSQFTSHAKYGGIVPEIASREHLTCLPELLDSLLNSCSLKKSDIALIAVTKQPGLIGSLLIGVSYAKALAWSLDIPIIGVDHLKAHIFSIFLDQAAIKTPFLSLLVSGGHTHLYLVKSITQINLLGKTLDDACGEAFDKAAQMLGLVYPGGPSIEALALMAPHGATLPYNSLPIPMKNNKSLNFSYSGLKTALRNYLISQKMYFPGQDLLSISDFTTFKDKMTIEKSALIAKSFQYSAFAQLEMILTRAIKRHSIKTIAISGGVSINKSWQQNMSSLCAKHDLTFLKPLDQYTRDNGAMIAFLGYQMYQQNQQSKFELTDLNLEPKASSELSF
ncbi:MAG: tRNA (adenosine(37)-N6)-threonylcarbamoyltransferase complex transferase subunit TsaD [SAR324 cluster bacterium]|nr:tRNA (adenosine(37)-N6)-threonylcarbamoyltransferase complex transferase subunit TsaD [SAR324 cluster bacterium]